MSEIPEVADLDLDTARAENRKILKQLRVSENIDRILDAAVRGRDQVTRFENDIRAAEERLAAVNAEIENSESRKQAAISAEEQAREKERGAARIADEALDREMERMRGEVESKRVDIEAQILSLDGDYTKAKSDHDIRMAELAEKEKKKQAQIDELEGARVELAATMERIARAAG